MARKKSTKVKEKETLCNNVPDLEKIEAGAYHNAEPLEVGSGDLPLDGGLAKALGQGENVCTLSSVIEASPFFPHMRVMALDKEDSALAVTLPTLDGGEFKINLTKRKLVSTPSMTEEGRLREISKSVDTIIADALIDAADDLPKTYIPSDFTETEIFHRVLRDAFYRHPNDFAIALNTKDAGVLLRMEQAVRDVVDYSIDGCTTYAGIPIIPSPNIPTGDMYLMSKDTSFLAFRPQAVMTDGRALLGAGLSPESIVYKASKDCHTVWYEYSEDSNDYCIECDTCGYSYWAGDEDAAVERLEEHTDSHVFFKNFRGSS